MKHKRYSEQQIITLLKEAEVGVPVTDLVRQNGFSQSAILQMESTAQWYGHFCP